MVDTILKKLGLNRSTTPSIEGWTDFLSQIKNELTKMSQERVALQAILELGNQETKGVWDLIQEREALIKSILDSSQDVILVLDQELQIIEFNNAAEVFFKVSKNEISGQPIFKIMKGGKLFFDLKSLPQSQGHISFLGNSHESTLLKNDGSEVIISVFPKLLTTSQGDIYSIYFRDLTKTKEIEKQLDEARAQMVSSSKLSALGEMAGGVAHEVNTPLAVIQLRADQLLDRIEKGTVDIPQFKKYLEGIVQTVSRISNIINALRSFSRDGRKDPKQSYEVSKIIEDTFLLCNEKFLLNGVKLIYSQSIDVTIECRPSDIAQVLLNLLSNSYDAIQELPEKWITVSWQKYENYIEIIVTDSGRGIDKEVVEKMMQPFFTTKPFGKGTGLGLSISKGLIESNGGLLRYNPEFAHTQFVIQLPIL